MTLDRDDDIRLAEEDAAQADLHVDASSETLTDEEAADVAEIRAEIEETRLEMGDTLTELGDRLEPSNLVNQAKENVREATIGRVEETAKGMTDMVMETIKRNPIPAAIAGTGLALLWKNRAQGTNGHAGNRQHVAYIGPGYAQGGYGQEYYGDVQYTGQSQGGVGQKVGDVASTVGDTARGAVGTVGETVGQVGQNVGQTAGQIGQNVGQTAGQIGQTVGQTVEQVSWRLESFMRANPLAMGAIALGTGAVIGSLVPETQKEQELLGDASHKVGSAVRDTVDQATTQAEEQLDKVEEKVSSPA